MPTVAERSNLTSVSMNGMLALGFNAFARFIRRVGATIVASPELFLPVACIFAWQVTAIAVKIRTLGLAVVLTASVLIYSYRVLGRTPWLRRLGWVSPRQGFWFYSVLAGIGASAAVLGIAKLSHQSLGAVPAPHRVLLASSSGPMLEELLFRGLLYWAILEFLGRRGVSRRMALTATVILIALGFAFAHTDRGGARLYATILTGIAYGWMRVQSASTAAATLMHAVYNFVLSYASTF